LRWAVRRSAPRRRLIWLCAARYAASVKSTSARASSQRALAIPFSRSSWRSASGPLGRNSSRYSPSSGQRPDRRDNRAAPDVRARRRLPAFRTLACEIVPDFAGAAGRYERKCTAWPRPSRRHLAPAVRRFPRRKAPVPARRAASISASENAYSPSRKTLTRSCLLLDFKGRDRAGHPSFPSTENKSRARPPRLGRQRSVTVSKQDRPTPRPNADTKRGRGLEPARIGESDLLSRVSSGKQPIDAGLPPH
jgi:hypothetical protein